MTWIGNVIDKTVSDHPQLMEALTEFGRDGDTNASAKAKKILNALLDADALEHGITADQRIVTQGLIVYAKMRVKGTGHDVCKACALKTIGLISSEDLITNEYRRQSAMVRLLVADAAESNHERMFSGKIGAKTIYRSKSRSLRMGMRKTITNRKVYDELFWLSDDPSRDLVVLGFENTAELEIVIGDLSSNMRRYHTSRKRMFRTAVECAQASDDALQEFLRIIDLMLSDSLGQPLPSAKQIIDNAAEGLPESFLLETTAFESEMSDINVKNMLSDFKRFIDSRTWDDQQTGDVLWGMVFSSAFEYKYGKTECWNFEWSDSDCRRYIDRFSEKRHRQIMRIISMIESLPENVTRAMPATYYPYSPQYTDYDCRFTFMDILELVLKHGEDGIIRWKTLTALNTIIENDGHGREFTRLRKDIDENTNKRVRGSRLSREERRYIKTGKMMENITIFDESYPLKALLGKAAVERLQRLQTMIKEEGIIVNDRHEDDIMKAWKNTLNR